MAVYHAFYIGEAPPQQALRAITRNRVSPAIMLPISYNDKIKQMPGVVEAMPSHFFLQDRVEPRRLSHTLITTL